MASIALVVLGFIAVIAGLLYFYNKTKSASGSVIVLVAGLLALYIVTLISDMLLARFGFDTGFPDIHTGYYFFQSMIYLVLGLAVLGTHHFLLRETENREISYAFQWAGMVLLITGGLDLLVDVFIRIDMPEIRLLVAVIALGALLFIVNKYRHKIFDRKEERKM